MTRTEAAKRLAEAARELLKPWRSHIAETNLREALAAYDDSATDNEGGWRPIDDKALQAAEEEYIWTCIAGTKFPYLATYEDADWWTLNQQYESAYKLDDPRRLYRPTHWIPFNALPAPPAQEQKP